MKARLKWGFVLCATMLMARATPQTFVDSVFGFDWMLNGSATTDGVALTLTPNAPFQAGSAFITNPLPINADTSLHAFFAFNISGGSGADGLTFTLQNDPSGVSALGAVGGAFGYAGSSPDIAGITPSLAVEFDTIDAGDGDPDDNHVGIDQNGALVTSLVTASPPFVLRGGDRFAWVDYDGTTNTLDVFLSTVAAKPAVPLLSFTFALDLNVQLGSQAFVGFTAGTGLLTDTHKILTFHSPQ
jgi:Legume lectin domain